MTLNQKAEPTVENANTYGKVIMRNVPVLAIPGVRDNEVVGKLLHNGRRMTVFFPSRREVKEGEIFHWDIVDMGRCLKANPINGDESKCQAPLRQPGYWKVTNTADFTPAPSLDNQSRSRYYFRTGHICYLAADMGNELGSVGPNRPVWVVTGKSPACLITADAALIALYEDCQADEGRLPDMTVLRTGKFRLFNIDHQRLEVVGVKNPHQNGRWDCMVERTAEEALGVIGADGYHPGGWVPSSVEELEAYYRQALQPYEKYTPEFLANLLAIKFAGEKMVALLKRAVDHDRKKLRQIRNLAELRFKAHQESIRAAQASAKVNLAALLNAHQSGELVAPPRALTSGRTDRVLALEAKSSSSLREEWVTLVKLAIPDLTQIEGEPIEQYGGWLFSAAVALNMRSPLDVDDDPNVVIDMFNDAEFPHAYRWPVLVAIRSLQGIEETEIPSGLKTALEEVQILTPEEIGALTQQNAAHELIDPYERAIDLAGVGERRARTKIAGALAVSLGCHLFKARKLDPEVKKEGIKKAYELLKLPLGPRTTFRLMRILNQ